MSPPDGSSWKRNRIAYWSIGLALGWPIALVLAWAAPFEISFYAGPLAIIGWGLSGIAGLVLALAALTARAWGRMLGILILPATALVAAINVNPVWNASIRAGNFVHVWVMMPAYLSEIAKLPADQPKLMVFDWGSFADISLGAIYDETDEIALPPKARSAAWNARAVGTEAACHILAISPVGRHFYAVRLTC